MANFTGRRGGHATLAHVGWDVEREGLQGAPEVTVITGADAHVTLFQSVRMLGLGSGRVRAWTSMTRADRPAALREVLDSASVRSSSASRPAT